MFSVFTMYLDSQTNVKLNAQYIMQYVCVYVHMKHTSSTDMLQ